MTSSPRAPSAPKHHTRGTHRVSAPRDTLDRVRPHLGAMGITRVADVTGLDRIGIPVAMAHRPNSRSLSVSPGKGLDLDAARASAVMEAIEGWHAEHVLRPLVLGAVAELSPSHRLADLDGLPRLAARPLDPHRPLLWIEGTDLLAGRAAWVPFELVHTNYTLPLPPSSGAFLPSSNGLASGNHPLEALSHALCELIERDAVSLFHARDDGSRQAARVDLATVDDPDCRSILDRFESAGVDVGVWDLTTDIGVATFSCEVVDRDPGSGRPFLPGSGSGTHPRRAIALLRALTEAAQTRLTTVAGARDDLRVAQYIRALNEDAWKEARSLLAGPRPRAFHDAPDAAHESLDDDVIWLLARLAAAGIRQAIAVDLSRPGLGVSVVRAVVPGLEGPHDAPGLVPGPRRRRIAEGES